MEIIHNCLAGKQYLVIKGKQPVVGYEGEMLERNTIQGLVPFYTVEKNGEMYYWYDSTGKESVEEVFKKRGITYEELERFFSEMDRTLKEISGYLIDERNLVFRTDAMFYEDGGMKLMYYPCANDGTLPYIQIGEFLITNVDPKLQELNELCYEIYHLMASPGFDCSEMAKRIRQDVLRKQEAQSAITPIIDEHEDISANEIEEVEQEKRGLKTLTKEVEGVIKKKAEELKLTVSDLIPEVVKQEAAFEDESERYMTGRLIYDGEERELDYCIDKDLFKIGREDKRNDACLHSDAVSKHHSKILRKNGKYYLADWNSKKGTYYNGRRLRRGEYVELASMDRVVFADVPYTWA